MQSCIITKLILLLNQINVNLCNCQSCRLSCCRHCQLSLVSCFLCSQHFSDFPVHGLASIKKARQTLQFLLSKQFILYSYFIMWSTFGIQPQEMAIVIKRNCCCGYLSPFNRSKQYELIFGIGMQFCEDVCMRI